MLGHTLSGNSSAGEEDPLLKRITLRMARTPEFPEGSPNHGYEIVAPLDGDGHLDKDAWHSLRGRCRVRRFWAGEPDRLGHLLHRAGGSDGATWTIDYDDISATDTEDRGFTSAITASSKAIMFPSARMAASRSLSGSQRYGRPDERATIVRAARADRAPASAFELGDIGGKILGLAARQRHIRHFRMRIEQEEAQFLGAEVWPARDAGKAGHPVASLRLVRRHDVTGRAPALGELSAMIRICGICRGHNADGRREPKKQPYQRDHDHCSRPGAEFSITLQQQSGTQRYRIDEDQTDMRLGRAGFCEVATDGWDHGPLDRPSERFPGRRGRDG